MVRAAYFYLMSLEKGQTYLEQLRMTGFNTALVADGNYQIDGTLWQEWAKQAEQQGISMFPVIKFAVPAQFRDTPGQYRPYVSRSGRVYPRTPCPLDQTYWEQVIERRLEQFAALAGTTGIVGAVFDTEMYGSDISLYTDLCLCDVCWQDFLTSPSLMGRLTFAERQSASGLPPAQRFSYLVEHDLFQPYITIARQHLQQRLRLMVQRLHQIAPAFRVGFLGYRPTWFYSALVDGLGTPELPALVFSESSYVRGYTPYVDRERDQVREAANHALYIPGLWLHRYFPQDVPAQLTDLALHTDGYWIYSADSLWRDDRQKKGVPLHGDHFAYWKALQQANYELLRLSYSAAGVRTIAPVRQSSFYDRKRRWLLTTPDLHNIFSDLIGSQTTALSPSDPTGFHNLSGLSGKTEPATSSGTYRGDTLLHCHIPLGCSLRLTYMPIGAETNPEFVRSAGDTMAPLGYTLFNDVGDVLQTGQITSEQPVNLSPFPVKQNEWVSLFIESGVNGVQVELAQGVACVFEASSTVPLETYQTGQTYQFVVAPGTTRLPFRAYCPPQQVAALTVFAPDHSISQTATITGFTEFQVEIPSTTAQIFWHIKAAPIPDTVFGNVRWYLYDYAYPYVIPGRD